MDQGASLPPFFWRRNGNKEEEDHMKASIIICLLGAVCFACNHNPSNPEPGPAPNTAAYKLATVNSLADAYSRGLRLMTVRSNEVNVDGTSETWKYMYVDTSMPPVCYWFHASPVAVAFDSNTSMMVGIGIISHRWFNSDSALMLAEQNGGSQFRSANPGYTITASLGEPVVPNPSTFWWVTYKSTANNSIFLMLSINADSGTVGRYPIR
jgi:hypothetical protein